MNLPSRITIETDTREQHPLKFPATLIVRDPFTLKQRTLGVKTIKAPLPAGDYRIAEYPNLCIVERKATVHELSKNLFGSDRHRAGRALVRLARSCAHPTLLIEATPSSFFNPSPPLPVEPDTLLSWLTYTAARLKLNLLWLPWGANATHRTRLGTTVAHHLLSYALLHLTQQRLHSLNPLGTSKPEPPKPSDSDSDAPARVMDKVMEDTVRWRANYELQEMSRAQV